MIESKPQRRWYRLTPDRLVLLLLVGECLLGLSNWLGWPAWHKGYAVLTCVAAVGVAVLFMGVWFVVALLFRLRFQFSIRTLLILALVVAVPFSWLAIEMKGAMEQKEVVAMIERLGGGVIYDWEFDKSGNLENELPPEAMWLRTWLGDDFFGEVVETGLEGTKVTDRDIAQVKRLEHLQKLYLERTQITDTALAHLAGLSELQVFLLGGTQITDAGLTYIAQMTKLQRLGFGRTRITDAGAANLAGLTKLKWLSLDDTLITDTGLSHLAGLMQLEVLWLEHTQITDSGLAYFARLPKLQDLVLQGTHVTDLGVARLHKSLPNCNIDGP